MLEGIDEDGVCAFLGVPYAAPPVGPLRWHMPQPPAAWSGVRRAIEYGARAPQIHTPLEATLGIGDGPKSENCLTLNIWTPAAAGAGRPVLVWIHGGAFNTGGGHIAAYRGDVLARRGDVVVVTVNYRLGAFGFLDLRDATDGALPATGSEGLADQIAALAWLGDNVAAFGGDPGNITLFGESAGAMSVGALLASPAARGLFHKAILQSGGAHMGQPRPSSAAIARFLIEASGLTPVALRDAPMDAILKAQGEVLDNRSLGGVPFMPTIDGALLPARPIAAVRDGCAAGVPLLLGTNRDEWNIFTIARNDLRSMDEAALRGRVAAVTGDEASADAVLSAHRQGTCFGRWNALMTDGSFMVPAARLAEAQGAFAPTFLYRFDWPSPFMGGALGACHTLEIAFVFGTAGRLGAPQFLGDGPAAAALCEAMMDAWIAFARTGDPSTAGVAWPRYDAASRRVMIFGDGPPHLVSAPNEQRRAAWDAVDERRIGPQASL